MGEHTLARAPALPRPLAVLALVVVSLVPPGPGSAAPRATDEIGLERVAENLDSPVWVTAPPRDARLFIVEQPGRIRVMRNGRLLPRPFLDITDRVRAGGERGLLSVAFHPRYDANGRLYVDYTDRHGDTRIERYAVSRDPDRADPASARLLLHITQPYSNHNGGLVMFGPDGMLWIGMGDGGSGGDPSGNGQNPATLLGKLLRIDVDHGDPYAIPRDNPFVGRRGARPEIWALGLRNPWRFCFDPASGTVVIADVGQNLWEEVNVAQAAAGGLNYGWNLFEGRHPYRSAAPPAADLVPPALEYGHGEGCSVIGGFVYRGSGIPALRGHYVYSDYCRGWLRSFRIDGGRAIGARSWTAPALGPVTSFGEDARGELYVTTAAGRVWRLGAPRVARR
jgi:hypothetical protein